MTLLPLSVKLSPIPPILKVWAGTHELRILLDFNCYYDQADLATMTAVAKENGSSLLLYHLPGVEDDSRFTPEQLELIIASAQNASWVLSRLEEQWKARYAEYAVPPEEHGSGYLCPISVGYYRGRYSARWVDCAYCKFNIASPPDCLCVAQAGIQTPQDFSRNLTERMADIEKIRLENERAIRDAQERRSTKSQMPDSPTSHIAQLPKTEILYAAPTQAELDAEYDEVKKTFNPDSPEWTVDRFHRRWIQCEVCGEIKRDDQMASYGGINGANRGICAACSRKRE